VPVPDVVRAGTVPLRRAVDVATGEPVTARVLAERVGWLCALATEVAQSMLDALWSDDVIERFQQPAPGANRPARFAYKQLAALHGWPAQPVGCRVPSRVVWSGAEQAGRALRSADHRRKAVAAALAGSDGVGIDAVTARNTHRMIGKEWTKAQRGEREFPRGLCDLQPAPRLPVLCDLAASDDQTCRVDATDPRALRLELLLPTVARPSSYAKWEWVRVELPVPAFLRDGSPSRPTLRMDEVGRPVAVLPVRTPKPKPRASGVVLGLDWGARRLLTGTVARALPEGALPAVDGRALFIDQPGLRRRRDRVVGHRQKVHARRAAYERLLTGLPAIDLRRAVLEAKAAVLAVEHERLRRHENGLNREIGNLVSLAAVEAAKAAGCGTVAVEDLATLEHRGLGPKTNQRVANGLRGRITDRVRERCEREGLLFREVNAAGTSNWCPRCDKPVGHRQSPDRDEKGYAWLSCPSCGHDANRDHAAAEKIAQRALTGKVPPGQGRVRLRQRKRSKQQRQAENAARVPPVAVRERRAKDAPTPKRPSGRTKARHALLVAAGQQDLEGRRRHGGVTPQRPHLAAHRSAGPDTQERPGTAGPDQCRADGVTARPQGAPPPQPPRLHGPGCGRER
jgi:hypothetical protein